MKQSLLKYILIAGMIHCMFPVSVSAQFTHNYYEQGMFKLQNKEYADAVDLFSYALERNSDNPDAWFYRGYCKYELADYHGAHKDFTACINISPYHQKAFLYRAMVNSRMMDYRQAHNDFDKAIRLDESDAFVYFQRAITMIYLKRYDKAIADCNKALDLGLNNVAVFTVRGIAYQSKDMLERSMHDFNSVLSLQPDNANVLVQKGIGWNKAGEQDSALHYINKAIASDSSFYFAYFRRAMIAVEDTAWDNALKDLNFILKAKPLNTSSLFYRALVYSQQERFDKAIEDYNTIIKKHPDNILALYNRAGLLVETKQYELARDDYDRVISIFPDFADAYRNRAHVREKLNMPQKAAIDREMAESVNTINKLKSDKLKFRQGVELERLTSLDSDFTGADDTDPKVNNIAAEDVFFILPPGIPQLTYRYYDVYEKQAYVSENMHSKTIALSNDYKQLDSHKIQSLVDSLNIVIDKQPGTFINYLYRASLLSLQNNFNQAMEDYETALNLEYANPLVFFSRANTFLLLGMFMNDLEGTEALYVKQQRPEIESHGENNPNFNEALDNYKKALENDSEMSFAWYNQAYARSLTANHWEGVQDFSKAAEIKPDFSEAFFNRGLTFLFLKEKSKACESLGKAGELGMHAAYDVIDSYCK